VKSANINCRAFSELPSQLCYAGTVKKWGFEAQAETQGTKVKYMKTMSGRGKRSLHHAAHPIRREFRGPHPGVPDTLPQSCIRLCPSHMHIILCARNCARSTMPTVFWVQISLRAFLAARITNGPSFPLPPCQPRRHHLSITAFTTKNLIKTSKADLGWDTQDMACNMWCPRVTRNSQMIWD